MIVSTPLRVAMVDPSSFSPPYDAALCTALQDAGHEVTLHCRPARADEPQLAGPFRVARTFYRLAERVRRLPGPLGRAAGAIKLVEHALDMVLLAWQLRRTRPDVVHLQWLVVPAVDRFAIRALRRVAPVIVTMHNKEPMHGNARSRVQTIGWRMALRHADHVVVHTDGTAAAMVAAGVPLDRVSVIAHGLLPSPAPPGGSSPTPAEERVVDILLFGRIRPYKGVEILLDAVALLPAETRRRARFHIVGEPLMSMEPLIARATELGIDDVIAWDLRFVPDAEVPIVFGRSDVVVLPYRDIDASGVLMKALTHGTAIVATSVGGFRDLLGTDGGALLVTPDDPGALAGALGALIDDEDHLARAKAAAGALAARIDDWEDIAATTVAVYRRCLDLRAA